MAVLEKIRVKFGLAISIIIALALLSFIIDPSTLESALNTMSSKYDVGQIAGKNISYSDFQSDIDRFTTINELLGAERSEENQKQIRNAAWQDLLDKYMFVKNAKEAGITVGEDEILALMGGEYTSPALAQNPVFMDENGYFSPDRLKAFIQNVDSDESGQLRTYWNYIQNTVHNQQYYSKYGALFTASGSDNALQLAQAVQEGNTTADVDYCMVYYPMTQNDSTIVVTDDEVRAYYKAHKNFFKQKANREIEYVVFEVVPSAADVAAASEAMTEAYDEFANTDSMRAFLLKNSDRGLDEYWYKAGELATVNAEIDEQIFAGNKLTQIVNDGNSFFAARELASKMMPDSAFVKHILLQGDGAARIADSLATVLKKGGNLANLAASYSADQASAADGELGSIGWMTQTYMIPGFEGVFDAKVGEPFVMNTQYGTHVVVVSRKTAPVAKKQVAILEKTALASKETFNNYYSQANTFATLAGGTYEGYQKALDSTKVYSHPATITEATSTFGSIDNAKELTRWAFDAKEGRASNIITVDNNYFFVAAVKAANKEGYAPVQKMASQIYDLLYNEKMREAETKKVAEKIAGATTIEEVAERLGVSVEHRDALSLSSTNMEPALLGAVAAAKEGVVSAPVSGVMGAYVVCVSNKATGSFYSENDAKNYAMQKAQYLSQMIPSVMQEYDNVKDNRERFF
jgi:peptidyl-prolyl cis-trans isomerase D